MAVRKIRKICRIQVLKQEEPLFKWGKPSFHILCKPMSFYFTIKMKIHSTDTIFLLFQSKNVYSLWIVRKQNPNNQKLEGK